MKETIIATDISLVNSDFIIKKIEVTVYLKEYDSVFNDWRAIKKELEKKLGQEVKNFTYRYK
jgi:hypothetical protein